MKQRLNLNALILAATALLASPVALAHDDAHTGHGAAPDPAAGHGEHAAHGASDAQKPWGIAGDPQAVDRVIEVRMNDQMRFVPEQIEVKQGETIRFVHRNEGALMHEFVLGNKAELDAHAAMMAKMPGMQHDAPYMVHVGPGQQGELVWTFNRAGDFDFACLIAGHYRAGMVGQIRVVAAE